MFYTQRPGTSSTPSGALLRRGTKRESLLASLDALIIGRSGGVENKRLEELRDRRSRLEATTRELKATERELDQDFKSLHIDIGRLSKKKDEEKLEQMHVQLKQCSSELADCVRILASVEAQRLAIMKQIGLIEERMAKGGSGSTRQRGLSQLEQRVVVAVSDDGFRGQPPKGSVYLHYDDGYIETVPNCTAADRARYEEQHGLKPRGYFKEKLREGRDTVKRRLTDVPLPPEDVEKTRKKGEKCVVS